MYNDNLIFLDESEEDFKFLGNPWKIIIADDDPEVHAVTKMVLEDFTFENRKLMFLSSYTTEGTIQLIEDHPDTALLLLDVVMDTEDSGLKVIKQVRNILKNTYIRIVLRTGQPGQAPEINVIRDYDINDYREKTELTARKLYTVVTSSIRAYKDLRLLEKSRNGLNQVVQSMNQLFGHQTYDSLAESVLIQLEKILSIISNGIISGLVIKKIHGKEHIISGIGNYHLKSNNSIDCDLPTDVAKSILSTLLNKKDIIKDTFITTYISPLDYLGYVFYLENTVQLTKIDLDLISTFISNVKSVFNNIKLNNELLQTQKEVIFTLGEVLDNRSGETGFHVRRVSEISQKLASLAGLSKSETEILKFASPMHDIGKIGIPDAVLLKPGKLTDEEYEIMKQHTIIGHNILKNSKKNIFQAAAIIALQHHEKYDGTGYPNGLKKEEIHIYSRITTIADVFDALLHKRVYKQNWSLKEVLDFFKENKGKIFDPDLIEIFMNNITDFLEIIEKYHQK